MSKLLLLKYLLISKKQSVRLSRSKIDFLWGSYGDVRGVAPIKCVQVLVSLIFCNNKNN